MKTKTIPVWIEGRREETTKDMTMSYDDDGEFGCIYCDYVHQHVNLKTGQTVIVRSSEEIKEIKAIGGPRRLAYLCGPKNDT